MSARVLGVDPGLASLGWGVVEHTRSRVVHVAHGCCTTEPGDGADWERAREIVHALTLAVEEYAPAVVAFERWVHYGGRRPGADQQAHNLGLVIGALTASFPRVVDGGRVVEWRAALGLPADASDAAIGCRVARVLGLTATPRPIHAAEALAVAIVAASRVRP